jgi:hypothetical protein
MIRRAL